MGTGDSTANNSWGMFDNFWTQQNPTTQQPTQGWGMNALSTASGLWDSWNAFQQVGIARDSLNENKRQFNMNWDAQKNLTNADLYNQQLRLRAGMSDQTANSMGILSPEDYVAKNGVK